MIPGGLANDHLLQQRQAIQHGELAMDGNFQQAICFHACLVFLLTKCDHRRFAEQWPFAYLFATKKSRFVSIDIVRELPEFLHHLLGEQYGDCLEVLPIDEVPNHFPLFDVLTCRQRFEQRLQVLLLLCDEALRQRIRPCCYRQDRVDDNTATHRECLVQLAGHIEACRRERKFDLLRCFLLHRFVPNRLIHGAMSILQLLNRRYRPVQAKGIGGVIQQ